MLFSNSPSLSLWSAASPPEGLQRPHEKGERKEREREREGRERGRERGERREGERRQREREREREREERKREKAERKAVLKPPFIPVAWKRPSLVCSCLAAAGDDAANFLED